MPVLHFRAIYFVLMLVAIPSIAELPSSGANNDEAVQRIVSGIISYTRWPTLLAAPRICIFRSSRLAKLVTDNITPLSYTPVIIENSEQALASQCDGLYFGEERPEEQVKLIEAYQPRPLLLIAEQNTQCLIGSSFCLNINVTPVKFAVNLDSLSRSGVRVNPDVLMLARNNNHD
ncbi:DUF4154 domain-containing protein [Atlantibacter hermannii]|uniref:YfiR family protein n=1 Tax=Atlantibacter hermannii TaxID=565 RepID=UPI001376BCF3|nr:YfiR family protein [Atlantibacter hermannii]NBD00447.1 DUF4154 domain-containing protein [Atlantibacter hermannii]